jgi:type II secretory pathway pseudopilin PulG
VTGRRFRRLRPLRRQGGYMITELLTVLVILTIIMGGLTALFVSATQSEVDLRERFQAQQEARIAMDALRREVHCASAISQTGPSATVTMTLATGCPSGTGSVTWCNLSAGTNRWRLYRKTGSTCDNTGKPYADYLTVQNIFSYSVATTTTRAKLHVELPVDVVPGDNQAAYRLVDDLVLRNSSFAT